MEVASAVGISFGTPRQYESGARGVSFGRLAGIANALGEPVSGLVGDAFGAGGDGDAADAGAVLRFARLASRLPRSRLNILVAVAWDGRDGRFGKDLAETQGFEPWVPLTGYDDLANRCLKPLGHVSGRRRD